VSATFSKEETRGVEIFSFSTQSRIWWYHVSMCFARAWKDWSPARIIAALLSQKIGVGASTVVPIPRTSIRNQQASFAASDAPMYSASAEDRVTTFCFRDAHNIDPDPREKV
jgi:hypothetical protein